MKRRFKTRLIFRVVSSFAAVVSFFTFLSDLHGSESEIYNMFYFLLFLYLAISFNKTEYILNDESLTIKGLFVKDKIILFDQIRRIEETKSIIPSIRIFQRSKKRSLLLLDNIDEFVIFILEATKGKKNVVFDQSGKSIDFKTL